MNTNNQKNLADVQLLAEWVYSHGEHEGTYLFASIYTELEEGTASFSVTEPTQNPDAEATSLSWEVVVDMDGEHWQAFFHAMVLEKLVEMYGYETENEVQDADTKRTLPENCHVLPLGWARRVLKQGMCYMKHEGVMRRYCALGSLPVLVAWSAYRVVAVCGGYDMPDSLLMISAADARTLAEESQSACHETP